MKHYAKYNMNHTPGDILEGNIAEWVWQRGLRDIQRPYIWPGAWTTNDLEWAANNLERPEFDAYDSMIIYYREFEDDMPDRVSQFNILQPRWMARWITHSGPWQPPRDLILVMDRERTDQVLMNMWLALGEPQ